MDFYSDYKSDVAYGLNPRQHIRKRPGMYVGGTGKIAMHHLVYEVLDHMVEEALLKRCDYIRVELLDDHQIAIEDNSHGLPTIPYRDTSFTWMDVLLQATGIAKSDLDPGTYRNPSQALGGLHGLGLSVVNALSEQFIVENCYDGARSRQIYKRGIPTLPATLIRDKRALRSGTCFIFSPDFTIFNQHDFDRAMIEKRVQVLASLTSGLTIEVCDRRSCDSVDSVFHYAAGLKTRVEELNSEFDVLHKPVHICRDVTVSDRENRHIIVGIEVAFQFSTGQHTDLRAYVNSVETESGGTHLTGVKAGLWSCLNDYNLSHPNMFDEARSLSWEQIASGLTAIVSIRHPKPQFLSPTTILLSNTEIFGPIAGMVYSTFSEHVSSRQSDILRRIIQNCSNHD